MALQITEVSGVFSVHGILDSSNANVLNRHMNRYIQPNNPVILNLERVQQMDATAAYVLQQLYAHAMSSNSILAIIGRQNKNLLSVFNKTKTSYILSNDRV
ncbi:STAS domain-containing protein [Flagellimonas nanhaiensis]|uniref:STAS domain-containing protein n=1 Tax=Flagellimonas nanhaiensis TaxID=2292706 RepID=A0A371JMQ7_9FLAO|nr:STAS domain-containing protein [Allomuricauda nanhaiensis]RDY58429.1 STAS domain-containing protein [Allomuricauda nanhaiensis]